MSPIKSLLRLTEAMIPCLPVFIMGLFRLHESRLSVIADIGNEAWGRSTGYNTCPGQPRFPYYHPPLLLDYGTNNQQPTRPFEQNPKPRIQCIAQQDNPAVKKNTRGRASLVKKQPLSYHAILDQLSNKSGYKFL